VRISDGMVGILLDSCSPRENSKRLTAECGVCHERTATRVRMTYGAAESELPAKGTVVKRVQGAMSYKFRRGLDVKNELESSQ
jgi:hypothetical protein